MLFVWIVLWLVSGLLLIANRRNPAGRWLSLVAFCGGMGALASVLEGWIVGMLERGDIYAAGEQTMRVIQRGCSWCSYYGLPYGFLCFGASYNRDLLPAGINRRISVAALALPLGMLLLPIADDYPVHYRLLAIWALPYFTLGALLLAAKRFIHPAERRAHALLLLAVLPVVLIALTMNYVLPLFGLYRLWVYNVWPIGFAFVIFLFSLFNFGFLGVQLLIEKRQLDYSLRAITSGTAMLNHAIKNDIGKIKLFADKMTREAGEQAELRADLSVVSTAAVHIEAMIRSVHERTQELRLQTQEVALAGLVKSQLAAVAAQTADKGIAVRSELNEEATAIADPEQTKEAIHNVLQNAIDAMAAGGGVLTVAVLAGRHGSTIEIRDTGTGIEKAHLRKVTEPFFTTKRGKAMNFGLGLAYCYQLMSRQGGELRISSEPGSGTTVRFHFRNLRKRKYRLM
ncbi:HAMP domain-containing histidine kinase [Paenibacillus rhizovicinus]|uniref:histidine kinase n=1 Tax=Paenibacillus rhizovicinus TaxID=2704463 RepID=A0A6C0P4N2_9BACL|nr:HAMP domain-containing sensor histidine kinase [Paenibacillus rhizovicinus]QHW33291.1 HAMP domain-containing histidine kinase [Paenibacillus rhizovicinus]